ncbi:MAG: hypothetical protein ACI4K7_09415, partial [Oscillospiraceae bacterium]
MNSNLYNVTYELFSRNAVEVLDGGDATDTLYNELVEKADKAITEYGWEAVFESWKSYIYENCHSKGIVTIDIADFVLTAVTKGELIGYQGKGTGRPIYKVTYNGKEYK